MSFGLMGAECIGTQLKDDFDAIPPIPPGFAPITLFNLQKVQDDLQPPNASNPIHCIIRDNQLGKTLQNAQDSVRTYKNAASPTQSSTIGDEKSRKSLRHRPSINYRQFDISSDEESDFEPIERAVPSTRRLPKGVVRGCSECENCQKVTARWRPEDPQRPVLDDAPVFFPTEEEFKDTLKYIASIRQSAENYGICRIVPPTSWRPTCLLKEKDVWENSKFATRIQQVNKLQKRASSNKMVRNNSSMRKRRKLQKTGDNSDENKVETNHLGYCNNSERFGFLPGPDFTLESFQKYADDFRKQYFCGSANFALGSCEQEPCVEDIEGEYWRIVERPTEEIEVLYGADVDTGVFNSGFPKATSSVQITASEDQYVNSGWNLNNFPRLPGSVLSFESGDISGVLVPWLYVGMCFSSFCWHVEDHHLYSLNYMHWGAPKIWYGVPGKDALKLEEAMKKHLPDLFEEQPDLLHNLVTQFSPSSLRLDGVPVYRCVQNQGEFVLTFPRAYHSGFNCGFNCAEAVNVAPVDWLPHGQNAVELYREQGRKISISHDKLLLGAAREAVRAQWNILFLKKNTSDNLRWKNLCGSGGILAKALKERIEVERLRREQLCSSQSGKMDASFDADSERECVICHYDLHLSAAKCQCSPDKFACLIHAKQLCSCAWAMKVFLFRYEISELNVLLDALAGKLSAVHRWGLLDLGLSLSSYVTKEKAQESKQIPMTNKEGKIHKDNTMVNKKIITDDSRYNLSKAFDAPKLQQEGLNENRRTDDEAKLTCKDADDASVQLTKSTNPSVISEQFTAVGGLHCSSNYKSLKATVAASSNLQHLSDNPSNTTLLQTDSDGMIELKNTSASKFANSEPQTCLLADRRDIITLGDDEVKDANKLSLYKMREEPSVRCSETLSRLTNCKDNMASCSYHKDQVLVTPQTNASLQSQKEIDVLPVVDRSSNNLSSAFADVKMQEGTTSDQDLPCIPDQQMFRGSPEVTSECAKFSNTISTESMTDLFSVKETCGGETSKVHHQHPQLLGVERQIHESKGKTESNLEYNSADGGNSVTTSPLYPQNSLDKYNCQQKGPRIAKVVRRVNRIVEALEYGVVLSGKLWSTSQAIYPKGFRSRVRYFSVLDPTKMCYYVSEILDAGLLGPLFMVVVEQCPSEVFIHVSATKCWDMVREKVNDQIRKQHSTRRLNLPSLQPPGSLDGLEMFGLSSPTIIQAIEALDQNFLCTEYWRFRRKPPTVDSQASNGGVEGNPSPTGSHLVLRGLFKKASPEELHALQRVLNNSNEELIHAIDEEIKSRQYPT
ncbi:lysine-specific demethylase JMJ703-like [Canna indica]|uniref:Lysine-specific demethylase JMJ703-like n=1 Tax=Canna indica TaxID=4628 RepID=A0AAQ3QS22_9LILI|nr:lysine-specific demethylase JMJ703-like [Canna indica]